MCLHGCNSMGLLHGPRQMPHCRSWFSGSTAEKDGVVIFVFFSFFFSGMLSDAFSREQNNSITAIKTLRPFSMATHARGNPRHIVDKEAEIACQPKGETKSNQPSERNLIHDTGANTSSKM